MPYRIPNADERKVYFAFLKQSSSLTAWQKTLQAHARFLEIVNVAFEDSQKNPPPDRPPYIHTSKMVILNSCHASLEQAVKRLERGDRSCFKWLGASGHFNEGMRGITAWDEAYGRFAYMGETEFTPAYSPYWPQMYRAMLECLAIYHDSASVLEMRHLDVPAPLFDPDYEIVKKGLALLTRISQSLDELPDVPFPADDVYRKTGDIIPYSGIWEPCIVPFSKGFAGMFKTPLPPKGSPAPVDGCMNYLHRGSPAPTIAFQEDDYRRKGRPTVWHLIWIDDRYGGKAIPEEEQHYVFSDPEVYWPASDP